MPVETDYAILGRSNWSSEKIHVECGSKTANDGGQGKIFPRSSWGNISQGLGPRPRQLTFHTTRNMIRRFYLFIFICRSFICDFVRFGEKKSDVFPYFLISISRKNINKFFH